MKDLGRYIHMHAIRLRKTKSSCNYSHEFFSKPKLCHVRIEQKEPETHSCQVTKHYWETHKAENSRVERLLTTTS